MTQNNPVKFSLRFRLFGEETKIYRENVFNQVNNRFLSFRVRMVALEPRDAVDHEDPRLPTKLLSKIKVCHSKGVFTYTIYFNGRLGQFFVSSSF